MIISAFYPKKRAKLLQIFGIRKFFLHFSIIFCNFAADLAKYGS